jgi:glycosyltransferase involved in cell wall biosynthesis
LSQKTKTQANIDRYVESETRSELAETRRATLEKSRFPRRCADYAFGRGAELYWTLTRLVGLEHWHDGSPAMRFARRGKALRRYLAAESVLGGAPARGAPTRRLLIDMSQNLDRHPVTGIQRVAWEICKTALKRGGVPVIVYDGRLFGYVGDLSRLGEVEIDAGDVLLVPGAWWAYPESLLNVMESMSARGGSNVVMQHDMIPFLHRDLCNHDARKIVDWFDRIVLRGDAVMCATKSVAHEFIDFVASRKLPFKQNLRLGWQAHGCDFPVPDHDAPMSARIGAICGNDRPFFLSVSTLEPRKGYSVALEAMERLWREGVDIRYVIVGRHGWNANALARRIVSHGEFGRRLFWLRDASDAELRDLYEHARGLVFPSVAEGFGLALIEAAHYGLPIIASDIPVFREIGGDAISYFDVADSGMLSERARECLAAPKTPPSIPFMTWRESTEGLLDIIETGAYQFGELRELIAARG